MYCWNLTLHYDQYFRKKTKIYIIFSVWTLILVHILRKFKVGTVFSSSFFHVHFWIFNTHLEKGVKNLLSKLYLFLLHSLIFQKRNLLPIRKVQFFYSRQFMVNCLESQYYLNPYGLLAILWPMLNEAEQSFWTATDAMQKPEADEAICSRLECAFPQSRMMFQILMQRIWRKAWLRCPDYCFLNFPWML